MGCTSREARRLAHRSRRVLHQARHVEQEIHRRREHARSPVISLDRNRKLATKAFDDEFLAQIMLMSLPRDSTWETLVVALLQSTNDKNPLTAVNVTFRLMQDTSLAPTRLTQHCSPHAVVANLAHPSPRDLRVRGVGTAVTSTLKMNVGGRKNIKRRTQRAVIEAEANQRRRKRLPAHHMSRIQTRTVKRPSSPSSRSSSHISGRTTHPFITSDALYRTDSVGVLSPSHTRYQITLEWRVLELISIYEATLRVVLQFLTEIIKKISGEIISLLPPTFY
ncbi:hypothetical protein PILCRDRAFT_700571 [Piloderma croceum F 1598]|uniref:Uncharacterized protein n=1 Tax=Piloderma croceum (strain F 1598) TaxID=765440 RepID=A0A0C3BBE9_PILCF|nr:hypothetical protein PILCRDRAFT_700571 [Piloderma croceum F 1598]